MNIEAMIANLKREESEELSAALEIAQLWKDVHTDESYGPQGKRMGIMSRALIRLASRNAANETESKCTLST